MSDTQKRVLDFIRSRGASGCTDLDIQRRFGNHGSTYRTRRAELTALGLVRDSGVRVMQDDGQAHRVGRGSRELEAVANSLSLPARGGSAERGGGTNR